MSGSNELVFIDRATGAIKQRIDGQRPVPDRLQPGREMVRRDLAAARPHRHLRRRDLSSWCTACRRRRCRAISPFRRDSNTVFVTLQGTNSLIAIDLASGKPLWTVPVGPAAGRDRGPAGGHVAGRRSWAPTTSPRSTRATAACIRRIQTGRGAHNFLAVARRQDALRVEPGRRHDLDARRRHAGRHRHDAGARRAGRHGAVSPTGRSCGSPAAGAPRST